MKRFIIVTTLCLISITLNFVQLGAEEEKPRPFSKTLLRSDMQGIETKEIILSLVELPTGKSAPLHTHPGEEFAYVIEGEAIQNLNDRGEETKKVGEVSHIPFGIAHTVRSGDKPLKALVVRIHEKGKPERVLVK